MTLDIEARVAATRRRVIRIAVGIGAGVLALLLAIALVTRGGNDTPTNTGSTAPADTTPPAAAAGDEDGVDTKHAQPPAAEGFVPPARRVVLPSGAEQVNEYPVKFPRTPEGAAALAVAMTRYSTTLDYAVSDEVLRLYSDPSIAKPVSELAAANARGLREEMGLSATGSVSAENAVVARPIGVLWKQVSKDVYDVSVLTVFEYRSSDPASKIGAGTSRVKWFPGKGDDKGDWKLVAAPGLSAPEGGQLGTKAFNDGGYAAIAEERR